MQKKIYQWAIVGAGPAGIAAVGKLLDQGISNQDILWIDPYFKVGDFGRLWSNVSSNTKVKLFNRFLLDIKSFNYAQAPYFALNNLDPENTCLLNDMVEPLQWVTNQLSQRVKTEKSFVHNLTLNKHIWSLHNNQDLFQARNIILATGAVPSRLNYPEISEIPFEIAIDKERLKQTIKLNETHAVFGSSHSAIMIIRYLVDLGVKKIINFYRSPCKYAIDCGDWILFDNTGLKGDTAKWAKRFIDGEWPKNLIRHSSNAANLSHYLPECHKAIYAVGFESRQTITMGDYEHLSYNPYVGIIGPGLFGLGIAYPEKKITPYGDTEMQVGLWKFMVYLNQIIPIWLKYHT